MTKKNKKKKRIMRKISKKRRGLHLKSSKTRREKRSKIKVSSKYPLIKKVNLDNSSRKGEYYYVKLFKGDHASYYKGSLLQIQSKIDDKKRRHGYKIVLDKRKKVEPMLGKGYSEVVVNNIKELSPSKIKNVYMDLLNKPFNGNVIVQDKELARNLALDTNVMKYKDRLAYEVDLMAHGEIIGKIRLEHKGKDLVQVRNDINKNVHVGQDCSTVYHNFNDNLVNKGYNFDFTKSGRIDQIKLKIIFRKG